MSRRYTYTTGLNRGGDVPTWEGDCEVSFVMRPGRPETPPSYAHGGLPAEDCEIDDIRLEKVDGKTRPWGMYGGNIPNEDDVFAEEVETEIAEGQVHIDAMIQIASEDMAADAVEAAEYRAEAARDDRTAGWRD